MKPLHIAVAAAVLLVAALVAFLLTTHGDRADTRRATGRESRDARPGGDGEQPAAGAGGGEANAGAGALSIMLRIVDADGNAAGGAEAEIDRGIDALRVAADGDGTLRVRGLATGIYDLRARHGKQAGGLRFELRRTTDLGTLKLSATITVRGRVFGPRGEPVPGASVEACRAAESPGLDMTAAIRSMAEPDEVLARAHAGDDGAYELALPEGGTYALRAAAEGFAQEGEPARRYAADTDGIDFWLMPGALLQGHVVDARQSPVSGARVLIADPMSLFGKRVPKAETATGADGAFSMVVQPAQQIMLIVRAAGYASYMQGNLTLPQTNLLVTLEQGVSLTLQAVDAERPDVPAPHVSVIAVYQGGFGAGETDDEGRLLIENLPTRGTGMGNKQQMLLWGGGYIAQTVDLGGKDPVDGVLDVGVVKVAPGGTIRGRVLDKTTGDPIAGARLRTFGGLDQEMELFGSVPAVSAPDGSFKLTGVPLAAHTILATHPDFVGDIDPQQIFGGMGGGSGGGPPLFPEGSRDIERDVEMTPAEVIAGVVLAPDGSPVAGASVTDVSEERMIFSQILGGGPGAAMSDERGAFALRGLRQGEEATVAATHRDWGPSEVARVRAGAGESVTLRLAEPLAIKGLVVDEAGVAVAGARVTATRAAEAGPRTPFDSGTARPTVTDGEGRYLLRNVPAGNLVVTFDHPDYAIVKTDISLAAAHDLGRTVLPRGASIGGEVVDADGKTIAGVSVHAWKRDAADFGSGGRVNASAVTDEKGRFRMAGLANGEFQLRIWDPRYFSGENMVKSGGADTRIVLRAAGRLVGRVTARGVAVAGASVRAQRGEAFVGWARTGQDGGFVMESLPPDEPFDVTLTHDAYRELKVEAVRASDRAQDFVMQPGAEVSGRVVDAGGRGVPGAEVNVQVDGRFAKRVETDASGAFTAGGLADGRIAVQLDARDQGFIPTEWLDVATGARDVRLVATPGESISGIARDREGRPLRQVSVMAIDAGGSQAGQTWIWDENGAFELRGLKPGTYTVRAQLHEQGKREPVTREVPGIATGTKGVEIRFP